MSADRAPRGGWRRMPAILAAAAALLAFGALATHGPRAATPTSTKGTLTQKTAPPVAEDRWVPRTRVYAGKLPQGRHWDIAGRACLLCHSATLITQQRKDSTGWEKTLTTMIQWGAPVDSVERAALRGYLLAKFGPRK